MCLYHLHGYNLNWLVAAISNSVGVTSVLLWIINIWYCRQPACIVLRCMIEQEQCSAMPRAIGLSATSCWYCCCGSGSNGTDLLTSMMHCTSRHDLTAADGTYIVSGQRVPCTLDSPCSKTKLHRGLFYSLLLGITQKTAEKNVEPKFVFAVVLPTTLT